MYSAYGAMMNNEQTTGPPNKMMGFAREDACDVPNKEMSFLTQTGGGDLNSVRTNNQVKSIG